MSSGESLAGLIQDVQADLNGRYIDLAMFAVVMYDWLLTFSDEIRIIWRRPMTGSKILFLLNRYMFIAFSVVNIMSDWVAFTNSNRRCTNLGIADNLFAVLHNLVISVFQVIRVYAITGRKWGFALPVAALNVLPLIWSIYLWSKTVFVTVSLPVPLGCGGFVFLSQDTYNNMTIAERVCLIVADVATVVATVYHTYGTIKASRDANIQATISSALLRAGILYFVVMAILNTVEIIVQMTAETSYFEDFPALFDYLLISHFLLNLQEISSVTINGSNLSRPSLGHSTQGQISSIRFADSVIGNLGENLRDLSHEDNEDADVSDGDAMAPPRNAETDLPVRGDDEDPMSASMPISDDKWEENVAGPSRLPMNDLHIRRTSEMTTSETVA